MFNFNSRRSTVKLIGHCLIANELDIIATERLSKTLAADDFDWGKLCQFAGDYWLLSYIHYALEQADLLACVPTDVVDELLAVRELIQARNQQIKQQLEQVIVVLNQHNIQPLLLKGASYLLHPVSDIQQLRMISDLDLFIADEKINDAIVALKSDGYAFMNFLPDGTDYHLDPLMKTSMPVRVELHTRPLAPSAESLISAHTALDNAALIQNNNLSYFIFSPEYRLIHQLAHAQIHSRDHANQRLDLRQLFDFHLHCKMNAQTINWPFIESTLTKHHSEIWTHYVLMTNLIFQELKNPKIDVTIEQRFNAQKMLASLSGENRQSLFYHGLERLSRLPGRLLSPSWHESKIKTLLNKS